MPFPCRCVEHGMGCGVVSSRKQHGREHRPQRALLTTQAASSGARHTAAGAIVGIAVGIMGGALVSSICVAGGYLFLRWVPAPQYCSSEHTHTAHLQHVQQPRPFLFCF